MCVCVVRRIPFSGRRRETQKTDLLFSPPSFCTDTESFSRILRFRENELCVTWCCSRKSCSSCRFITRFLPYPSNLLSCLPLDNRQEKEFVSWARNTSRSNIFLAEPFVGSSNPRSTTRSREQELLCSSKKRKEAASLSEIFSHPERLDTVCSWTRRRQQLDTRKIDASNSSTSSPKRHEQREEGSNICSSFFTSHVSRLTSILIPCHHMVPGITRASVEAHAVNIRKGREEERAFLGDRKMQSGKKNQNGKCAWVHT